MLRINSLVLFSIAGLLVACILGKSGPQAQLMLEGRLYKNDQVVVVLDSLLTTKNLKVGDKVYAHVKNNLDKGGDIYIYAGEAVWARVKTLKKPGVFGKDAKLVIGIDSTKSSGGTLIPLLGEMRLKGKGKSTFPFGWLLKGSDIEMSESDTCVAPVNVKDYLTVKVKP